jgi:hypothetical protein
LSINTNPGTRGSLRVFAVNPADRSVAASMDIPVIFGDPRENERFVQINAPLPGSQVNAQGVISVAGYAGGTFNGAINVEVFDASGAPLVNQPVTVDPATGAWQLSVNLNATVGGVGGVRASITSPADGAVIVTDNVPLEILPPPATPAPVGTAPAS